MPSCCYAQGHGHPGLGEAALKSHIDAHLLNLMEGQVPPSWMQARGWVACPHCGKSASSRRRGGVHETCAARARASLFGSRDEWGHLEDGWEDGGWAYKLRNLPHVQEVFEAMVYTKEFAHKGLLRL